MTRLMAMRAEGVADKVIDRVDADRCVGQRLALILLRQFEEFVQRVGRQAVAHE
ncbi:hypothetical protein N234_09480 [Ralstonia pickettii DTP0602]|nr:hypothetical protein N234_09480 [Ralstonia pickettii DTP0602]